MDTVKKSFLSNYKFQRMVYITNLCFTPSNLLDFKPVRNPVFWGGGGNVKVIRLKYPTTNTITMHYHCCYVKINLNNIEHKKLYGKFAYHSWCISNNERRIVYQWAQGRITIQICGRHIRYYDFATRDIIKQHTYTHGDVVIMSQRVPTMEGGFVKIL